ncbi:hypothetical protein HK27_12055 [Acetobacter orientalis]|uniref:hypothetical protein n=1 Tax=Acetobacter orientalis TaxID=146474 RepID=UPI000A3D3F65|nr:hypothetical protein [Acetobacter orientalis]OUJ15085.1 hypothetical protein HK27_12055 [Acetobacter orientalis]
MLSVPEIALSTDADLHEHISLNTRDENFSITGNDIAFNYSCFDYNSTLVRSNKEFLVRVLEAKYHSDFLRDAQQTGQLVNHDGHWFLRTNLGLPQFSGLVLEAAVVRHLVENVGSRRSAIAWCSRAAGMYPNSNFIKKWLPVGRGAMSTKVNHLWCFDSNDPHLDIVFLKETPERARLKNPYLPPFEPLTMEGTTVHAGIQVKAITCNEADQIVDPLISGKYAHVLTLLNRPDGQHSYDECLRLLSLARQEGRIDIHRYYNLCNSVRNPSQIGIDQYYINGLYEYISYWYQGRAHNITQILDGAKSEQQASSRGGCLFLPSSEIIQPNPTEISSYG